MNKRTFSIIIASLLGIGPVIGQVADPAENPDTKVDPAKLLEQLVKTTESLPGDTIPGLDIRQSQTSDKGSADGNSSEADVNSLTATQSVEGKEGAGIIEETEGGYWLKDAPLNEVFQYLAQRSSMQYFYNTNLSGPQFLVTGQLLDANDPVLQMEELGLMYEVTIHKKGNTVYALVPSQLSVLPNKPTSYQLNYLRPADMEKIKAILQPFLTPGTGVVEYEEKTNTIIVFDNNEKKVNELMDLLVKLDQPKQQVAIETRILRVNSNSRNRIGVDWGSVLGDGTPIDASISLNNLFNLPDLDTISKVLTLGTGAESGSRNREYSGSSLIFSPPQMQAVVRALNSGGLVQQESSPTLITEDNEEGVISIIDRVPIVVTTVSQTPSGSNFSEEVRYKIDTEDPVGDPATTREIGVSIAVTPTILPDKTVRMKLRPRSSQIVEFIEAKSGNSFPRVNESTVTTTARVPNSYSLLIGGFYEETDVDNSRKVPVLGDVPGLNFLFKSDDKSKDYTSLVFIVTPTLYEPANILENNSLSQGIHDLHVLPTNHESPDPERPGFNHKASMKNTFAGIFKSRRKASRSSPLVPRLQPEYEPRKPKPAPANTYYGTTEAPAADHTSPTPTKFVAEVVEQPAPSVQAHPVSERKAGQGGFFKQLFGRKSSR